MSAIELQIAIRVAISKYATNNFTNLNVKHAQLFPLRHNKL